MPTMVELFNANFAEPEIELTPVVLFFLLWFISKVIFEPLMSKGPARAVTIVAVDYRLESFNLSGSNKALYSKPS